MITHCNETISGLDTIRAFGKQAWFMTEMINRIDNHTKVFLIISSSNRWLGIALVSYLRKASIDFKFFFFNSNLNKFTTEQIFLTLVYSIQL